MAKAVLRFSNSSNPNYLIITWALFSTPLAEIGRQVYTAPHPQRSLTVIDLAPVMHRFSFFQSIDGTTLGTRLLDMDIDCSFNETEFSVYDYVVGRGNTGTSPNWADPVNAATVCNDQRLIGSSNVQIEHRGEGRLRADEFTLNTILGSFTLLTQDFVEDDTWFAVSMKVITNTIIPVPSSDYIQIVPITGNVTFDNTMYRKLLEVLTTANTPVISFNAIASYPLTKVLINTHSMVGRYITLAFSGAETVKFLGQTKNKITLGKGEEIELLFTGTGCRVMRYEGDYRRLGSVNYGRGVEINTIPLDGSLYNIADYPRLYRDFINTLSGPQVVTLTAWATGVLINSITEYPNKGFFGVDLVAGTFRVPDFRNRMIRALKLSGTDATRFTDNPGGFQMDDVGPHKHQTAAGWFLFGGAGIGNLSSNNDGVRQEPFNRTTDGLANSTGVETIMRNIGLIPQIII